jgi:hypothetical protein
VLFALVDRAHLLQEGDRPCVQRPITGQVSWLSASGNSCPWRGAIPQPKNGGQAISVSGLDLSGGLASFTGIVQSVEITRVVAKEKRFLVTINEVGATRRLLRWDADFLDRLSRDVGRHRGCQSVRLR